MLAVGYVVVATLLFTAFAVGAGICAGLWFGIRAMRPELLDRR
jgi:hypothetical protein